MNKKIILFGTGGLSHLLSERKKQNVEIVAYLNTVESDKRAVNGIPVIRLEEISAITYDYVVVAFNAVKKGIDILKKGGGTRRKNSGVFF